MPRKGQKLFPWIDNDYRFERELEEMRRQRMTYETCAAVLSERSGIPVSVMACRKKIMEIKDRDPDNDPNHRVRLLSDRLRQRQEYIEFLETALLDRCGLEPEQLKYLFDNPQAVNPPSLEKLKGVNRGYHRRDRVPKHAEQGGIS